ncbi:MAG: SxtJ family membrane protein, partial [Gemmatimonadaceae bacterium]
MKFAFTLAAAFAVLSALLAFRQRTLGAEVAFMLGSLLLVAGLMAPTRLGAVQRGWMAIGHAIGRVTGPIALALIYYIALTPIGYLRRTFGRSPLAR